MAKVYLTMLFVTLVAFNFYGLYQQFDSFDFDDVNAQVQEYAQNTAGLYNSGFQNIVETASGTVGLANTVYQGFTRFFSPIFQENTIGEQCTPYSELSTLDRAFLSSQRFLYNVLNDPNIETNEAYWLYEQERVYELECS